jgi:photosystem II stability/assembly factor-like uncharacterized protein
MSDVLVGTKKGLFVLEGRPGEPFGVRARAFAGDPVEYAVRDPRTGRTFAGVASPFYGPKLFWTDDVDGEWTQATGLELPAGSGEAFQRLWTLVPGEADGQLWAGGDPGVLFESRDGGASWALNRALWDEPSRPDWQPGGGGLCLHSIVPWPGEPDRLAIAISAAGVWLTDDGGASWRRGNEGLVPKYLPEDVPDDEIALCVHALQRAPLRPERVFMQFHGGVYRSDDGGETWSDIGTDTGLPSDFGFPITVDPTDPDSAFLLPLAGDFDRVTPDGRVRVFETRDAGASWAARGDGLPQAHAYLTILRKAFARSGDGAGFELYFGATSGDVYGSGDAGATWSHVAAQLPPVYSVSATG